MFIRNIGSRLLFLCLLVLAGLTYRPGLSGDFLFDDFGNLPTLGAYGEVDDLSTLARYLTSGTADPTGRPLSLASFLVDATNWPADPYPFKRTNLLLHLINSLLLWLLMARIGTVHLKLQRPTMAATLGAGMWLLHPFLVSTTLYIVQREAMLPATFVLLGLLGYLHGRERIENGKYIQGLLLGTGSILLCTALAALCKPNGILLPLLAAVLEFTVLNRNIVSSTHIRRLRLLALGIPGLLVFIALWQVAPDSLDGRSEIRPWTHAERLLSQPRMLSSYLGHLMLPSPYTGGLFNDNVQHSTGLFTPASTAAALFLITALSLVSLLGRNRFPMVSAAIGFFLVGHLLESTILPLELYFEHRNYLPAMLLFWPLGWWLSLPGRLYTARLSLGLAILLGLATMTWMRADLWGNSYQQALVWATINTDSARAQSYAAQLEMQNGNFAEAEARLSALVDRYPEQEQLSINLLSARCRLGGVTGMDLNRVGRSLRSMRTDTGLLTRWFESAIAEASNGRCPGLTLSALEELLVAARSNPMLASNPEHEQDILHLFGRIALLRGETARAEQFFEEAVRLAERNELVMLQAGLLAQELQYCAALLHLDRHAIPVPQIRWSMNMRSVHQWILNLQGYWSNELAGIRSTIRQNMPTEISCG